MHRKGRARLGWFLEKLGVVQYDVGADQVLGDRQKPVIQERVQPGARILLYVVRMQDAVARVGNLGGLAAVPGRVHIFATGDKLPDNSVEIRFKRSNLVRLKHAFGMKIAVFFEIRLCVGRHDLPSLGVDMRANPPKSCAGAAPRHQYVPERCKTDVSRLLFPDYE